MPDSVSYFDWLKKVSHFEAGTKGTLVIWITLAAMLYISFYGSIYIYKIFPMLQMIAQQQPKIMAFIILPAGGLIFLVSSFIVWFFSDV